MLSARYPRLWLAIGWAMVIAAFIVCLVPGRDLPDTGMSDKSEHFICYATLMLWFAGLYPRARYWIIAGLLLLMGIIIEVAQGAMHLGRSADWHDVVANSIGIVIGLALAYAGLGNWMRWIDGWLNRRTAVTDQ